MSGTLDEFLGGKAEDEPRPREPEAKPEPEPQQTAPEPEAKPEPEEPKPEGEPEQRPPEREDRRQVPVAALEAERRKRQEREAEAADLRRQLDEFRRQQPPQQAQPQPEMTDEQRFIAQVQENARAAAVEAATNRELNRSERAARAKYGDERVDAALAEYQRVYQMAPQVQQVVLDQPDPFAFIVEQSAHVREVGEFSRDGSAYRQRIEAELRAKWEAEMAEQQRPAAPPVPRQQPSLATARSSAPRAAAPYSGPTPLEDILRR